ncbi:23763_t:CDS:2 [Cetraspora pellucida]|uniref:DNA-directed DNA polymerase n=1 Tax=Cetraspora pellucida TaxID=1433469 RepID=A0A9N9ER94_9GLOM|nr:23763_t:CDS:2 [Cetraspora pellucida]
MLEKLSDQLSKLINIPFSDCLNIFQVSESMLEEYAIELAYYCSVDTLQLHKLNLKRNIIGDYIQRTRIACMTIFNVFTNGIVRQGMYNGGLVISPIKNIKRPVADVDFTSYYPYAIIQNNISLEKCVSKDSTNPYLNTIIDNSIMMINFVKEQRFIVVYGDTDSIFYLLPESYFIELDTKKKHYVTITHSDVPNLNNLNLLLKDLKIIKCNMPEFYKLVAKELIYFSLGFNKNFSIRQEELDQKELVIQIITNYVNKKEILLDLFVLTAKFDPIYASVLAVDFQIAKSDTKKGNKMVNNFVARLEHPIESERIFYYVKFLPGVSSILDRMILIDYFNSKKDTIDIIYYFYSLQDIVAYLLDCEKKQALKKIKEIFDAKELKKQ